MIMLRPFLCLLLVYDAFGYVCFESKVEGSSNLISPKGIECPGPCLHCESITYVDKQNTERIRAQSCGLGVVRLADTVPLRGPLAQMLGGATVNDLCEVLGLGDVEERTCIDDIDQLVRLAPLHLQPLIPPTRMYVKAVRVCCCRGNLCNDLTFPEPKPSANQCFHSRNAETQSVPCDGPCYTLQVAKKEGGQIQEFAAQGCSSDTLELSAFVPARALMYFTSDAASLSLGGHRITNICPLLGLEPKEQTVCVNSPKKVLKTLVPRTILGDNLVDFLVMIENVRICCCQGDHCNTPPEALLEN